MKFSALIVLALATHVHSHGTEIRHCISPEGHLRVFIEHWHNDLSSGSQAGTATISINGESSQNILPTAHINNVTPEELSVLCKDGADTTEVANCGYVENDWVYFDFENPGCGDTYEFLAGNTQVLDEGCNDLYPTTIVAPCTEDLCPGYPKDQFRVREIHLGSGEDSAINSLTEALAIDDAVTGLGPVDISGTNYFVDIFEEGFLPDVNVGTGTNAGDGLFSGQGLLSGATAAEQYLVSVKATVEIPAGTWTIAVHSDDGRKLQMPGIGFTEFDGTEDIGAVGGDSFGFEGVTAPSTSFAVFTTASPTTVDLYGIFFERTGEDVFEIAIAQGNIRNMNDFTLLADGVLGWKIDNRCPCCYPTLTDTIGGSHAVYFAANGREGFVACYNTQYGQLPNFGYQACVQPLLWNGENGSDGSDADCLGQALVEVTGDDYCVVGDWTPPHATYGMLQW